MAAPSNPTPVQPGALGEREFRRICALIRERAGVAGFAACGRTAYRKIS